MLDVANDMSARLEYDFAAANGAFDPPVHDNAFGFYAAIDGCLRGNEQGGAVHIALDVTVNLDQTLGGNAPCNLQAFCNDGSSTPEKHELPSYEYQDPFTLAVAGFVLRSGGTVAASRCTMMILGGIAVKPQLGTLIGPKRRAATPAEDAERIADQSARRAGADQAMRGGEQVGK